MSPHQHALRAAYDRVVAAAIAGAPSIAPIATGLTASIDAIYHVDEARLASLLRVARTSDELAQRIIDRIAHGRGGEIVVVRDDAAVWLRETLGTADVEQIGGNAAQASWALAQMGAPTVLALRDRSATQLSVLDDAILVATARGLERIGGTIPLGSPLKSPHAILEFTAGTMLDGTPLPRSTRVMLRFSHEPLETDHDFSDYVRTGAVSVALLSGLATQPDTATPDVQWARALAQALRQRGIGVHHELSEFADPAHLRSAVQTLPVTSLGFSVSELRMAGGDGTPAETATNIAEATAVDRIVVHADEWALLLTREPSETARDTLVLANALASARARHGIPVKRPLLRDEGTFTDDIPAEGPVRDGWHAVVVPSPHEPRPRATVGLGDTFVAGLLLGDALHQTISR